MGRTLDLSLRPRRSVISRDASVVLHDASGIQTLSASDFPSTNVEGFVDFDAHSSVLGQLDSRGMFEGAIHTRGEIIYVEPARRYLYDEDGDNRIGSGEAIVYRHEDIRQMPRLRHHGRLPAPHLQNFPNFADDEEPTGNWKTAESAAVRVPTGSVLGESSRMSEWHDAATKPQMVCKFRVVADHFLYQGQGASNEATTMALLDRFMVQADEIFSKTDFDGDGQPENLRIRVTNIQIYKDAKQRGYHMGRPGINATEYLELFSRQDHNGYCGAMIFSDRVFEDDVLGYAYRGGPGIPGGICYKRRQVGPHVRSLNVGMVSLTSAFGKLVFSNAVVVITHEIGHMFGSPHDEDIEGGRCFTQNEPEQYLMSSIANSGRSKKNLMFSECSRKLIYANLKSPNGGCISCVGRACNTDPSGGATIAVHFWSALLPLIAVQLLGRLHHPLADHISCTS